MRTQNVNPKLLFEFYKGDKVPPLVKRQQNLQNSQPRNVSPFPKMRSPSVNSVQTVDKKPYIEKISLKVTEELRRYTQENVELRKIIQDLTQKSQMLQEVNQRLINRIDQIEQQAKSQAESSDLQKKSIHHRVRTNVYLEIEEYLKVSIEKFMTSLRKEKMSPIVENKIEGFLEEVININQNSVQKYLRNYSNTKTQSVVSREDANSAMKELMWEKQKQRSISKEKERRKDHSAEKSNKYQTIFQKLNNMSPSRKEEPSDDFIENGSPSFMERDAETSPMRSRLRPRIFNQKYATDTKNRSLRTDWM